MEFGALYVLFSPKGTKYLETALVTGASPLSRAERCRRAWQTGSGTPHPKIPGEYCYHQFTNKQSNAILSPILPSTSR
jgi:hypothetical protein